MSGPELLFVAAATQAVGAIQQGNAQAAQYRAQAQANEYNASVQRAQAQAVSQQASAREDLQRQQARRVLGEQLAATAESGVTLTGSASDIFRQSLLNAEQDALNIRYEGELNRVGFLNQAQQSEFEAQMQRKAGKQAKTAGYLSAAGALAMGGYQASKGLGVRSGGPAPIVDRSRPVS